MVHISNLERSYVGITDKNTLKSNKLASTKVDVNSDVPTASSGNS